MPVSEQLGVAGDRAIDVTGFTGPMMGTGRGGTSDGVCDTLAALGIQPERDACRPQVARTWCAGHIDAVTPSPVIPGRSGLPGTADLDFTVIGVAQLTRWCAVSAAIPGR
jgi:hypothetical protein